MRCTVPTIDHETRCCSVATEDLCGMIPPEQGCTHVGDRGVMLSLPLGTLLYPPYVGVLFVEYNEGVIPIREERRREGKSREDE